MEEAADDLAADILNNAINKVSIATSLEDNEYDPDDSDIDNFQHSPLSVDENITPRKKQKKRRQLNQAAKDHATMSDDESYTEPESVPEPLPSPERDTTEENGKSNGSSSSPEEGDIGLSPGQEQAMKELQDMRNELGYTEEDPPDYDVTERVKQLNEELAQEPDPEDDRERSIKFKDKLVDFVVPAEEFSDNESDSKKEKPENNKADTEPKDNDDKNTSGDENIDAVSKENNVSSDKVVDSADTDVEKEGESVNDSDDNEDKDSDVDTPVQNNDSADQNDAVAVENNDSSGSKKSGNKVLIERDGKFDLYNTEDLTAEEKDLYLPKDDDSDNEANSNEPHPTNGRESSMGEQGGDTERSSASSSVSSEHSLQPHPPKEQRPATAPAAKRRNRQTSAQPRRSQSAQQGSFLENFSYVSPYAMSDEEKKQGERNKKYNEKQEKERKRKEQEEKEKKQEDNDDAFKAWLEQKKQHRQRSRSNESKSTNSSQKTDNSDAFDAWLKKKDKEHKNQEKQEKHKREEQQGGYYSRNRKECDQAFKQWLRKKSKDFKRQQMIDKHRMRISQLLGRRTHTALAIARAMRQSQTFHYVDYYGYRY